MKTMMYLFLVTSLLPLAKIVLQNPATFEGTRLEIKTLSAGLLTIYSVAKSFNKEDVLWITAQDKLVLNDVF